MPALQRVATPAFARGPAGAPALPARARVHPALHAGLRRLAARLRPEHGQLRRQRPLRAHPADLQRVLVRRQPGGRHAHPDPAVAALRRAGDRRDQALPGRRHPGAAPTAPRPSPTRATSARTTATRASSSPAREAHPRPRPPRDRRRRGRGAADPRRRGALPRPRDLRQRRLRDPGRGRQGRRRQGRQDRRARRHRRLQGRRRAAHRRPGLPGLPPRRRVHDPPAVADRRALRRVRADPGRRRRRRQEPALEQIDDGPGEGQYLLPVENTTKPVDLDLLNNITRLPERARLSIILNELGTGVAGRGSDLNEVIRRANPALKEVDKVLADPRLRERHAASSWPSTATPCWRRWPASAATCPRRSTNSAEVARGDRRAPRRARGRHRAAARLPARAAADDGEPRRLRRRGDAGARATCTRRRRPSTA